MNSLGVGNAEHLYGDWARILDLYPDGVLIVDAPGRVIWANPAAQRILGLTQTELVGRLKSELPLQLYTLAGEPLALEQFPSRIVVRTGRAVQDIRFAVERSDGMAFVDASAAPFALAADGTIERVIVSLHDITERVGEQEERAMLVLALDAERARLRTVIDHVPVGVLLAEAPSGRIILASPLVERLLGHAVYYAPDVSAYGAYQVLHADGRAYAPEEQPLARALRGERIEAEEVLYRRGDGRVVWLRASAEPIRERDGQVIGAVLAFHDIERDKRAGHAQQLVAEASRILATSLDYQTTLDSVARLAVPDLADACLLDLLDDEGAPQRLGIACVDAEAERRLRQMTQRWGVSPDPQRNLILEVIRLEEPRLVSELDDAMLRRYSTTESQYEALASLPFRSAMILPLVARGRAFGAISFGAGRDRRPYDLDDLTVARDLADRAALAIDNARLYHEAQAASESKSNFIGVLSHEFRTPLTAIVGYADLLDSGVGGQLAPRQLDFVKPIRASAWHLSQLIDEILTFSRLEAGREEVQRTMTDLTASVREVADILEPVAASKGLRLMIDVPSQPVPARTDAAKIRQILLNLLNNAIKFTAAGTVTVRVRSESGRAVLEVVDTGIGIPAEHHERIFERFWQVEQGPTRRAQGTGLGLAIVRRLTKLLEGEVTVISAPGEGSTFNVWLPVDGDS
ncbi:MAG: PAS domain-containing sensor histidine kinase [Longimicrobiales bacterium]